ncbi:hypothetical protein [Streptomyces xanthochromogenes]|uniref:hypothetical protein n=1 Tax=Streptomyces xanthochromogenes TaxID=67384 RepID=UPI001675E9D7|nr:hypothetical protein [Streptomyces xanthochromogenes]
MAEAHCGSLTDVPVTADPAEAQAAAAAMVVGLAHDFHKARVDVIWDPPQDPGSWTAQITMATSPANTIGQTTS